MKVIKKLSVLVMLVLIFSILAACSGNDESSGGTVSEGTSDEVQNVKQPVTIDFWHIWSDGTGKEVSAELISDFQKQHPEITVKDLGVSFWDYWTKISTAIAGGSGPDVAFNDINNVPARAKAGAILKLDEYITRDNFDMNIFFPNLIDVVKYNGSVYALPLDTDVRVLYYNKAAFREVGLDPAKPPANWDELEQYADKLTKWNGDKMLDRIGFSPFMGNAYLWTWAWTNGGDFFDDQGNPTINKQENIETLEWMVKIQNKYGVKAIQAFNSQTGSLGYSPFIAGKIAMVVDNNTLYSQIKQYAPDMEFGVAPIPYRKQPASWSNGFTLEIVDNKDKAKADAAWEFLKFMTDKEAQMKLVTKLSDFVANRTVAEDPSLMSDPVWASFVEQMKVSKFREYIEASPSWFNSIGGDIDAAANGKKTPKQALDDAQKLIENEIANYKQTQK
ncbi:ABC transporter substrate-binding protein [Mahella australiensis]|uniref:Extracellular solute-binding protein family 1 n=1 Tax=Mahella australiensis (strain DSM 15567 / CIP 107919 / 50-1 BON) TaxID=697281 RepID=F4A164_MAHA5|nr:ABC transporter substrate-binding protein [Mahella australiensis]AEE95967.1 extracellular solute-binding protein family 1 [Mahella australiensis 50-1 BON]